MYIMDCYRIVCAYLLMLVRWGLFDKVELHFGLKGHTHDERLPRSVLSVLTAVPKHMLALVLMFLWVTCFVVCIYLLFSSNTLKLASNMFNLARLPPPICFTLALRHLVLRMALECFRCLPIRRVALSAEIDQVFSRRVVSCINF